MLGNIGNNFDFIYILICMSNATIFHQLNVKPNKILKFFDGYTFIDSMDCSDIIPSKTKRDETVNIIT